MLEISLRKPQRYNDFLKNVPPKTSFFFNALFYRKNGKKRESLAEGMALLAEKRANNLNELSLRGGL